MRDPEKEIIVVPDDGKTVREQRKYIKHLENWFLAVYIGLCITGTALCAIAVYGLLG